jgi:uncharacterized repeat protein (TIGR03806 family)
LVTIVVAATRCGGGGADGPGVGGSGGAAAGAGGGAGSVANPGPQTCVPPPAPDQPIMHLAQTGCMSPTDPTKMAPTVVPYEVNSPLWSDDADKERGFALPDGATIHVNDCTTEAAACKQGNADDGRWVFPVGTVMVKNFMFDGKVIETRLLVHTDAQKWNGYSYQWNEAQTDATVNVDDVTEVQFNTGKQTVDWHYPSRRNCDTCHTNTGGFTLGPTTPQMNRTVGGKNQIDAIAARGLFDGAVTKLPALPTPYPSQAGSPDPSATVEERARSYLQANCAFCHRPDDFVFPFIDLRYGTTLADMQICNVTPGKGDVSGVQNANLLTPGDPGMSVLWLRMDTTEESARMPRIARYVNDQKAIDLVGQWITGVTSCPDAP